MSKTAEIEKVALLVQIEGKLYQVGLSQEKLKLVTNLAASLSDTGALPLLNCNLLIKFETT